MMNSQNVDVEVFTCRQYVLVIMNKVVAGADAKIAKGGRVD